MMDPKILNKVIVDDVTGCWNWQGAKTTCGYPVIARGSNTNIRGHRYVYEWVNGKIEDGHVVRHTCDNPLCVNPDHLVSGTPAQNVKDMDDRGRRFKLMTSDQVSAVIALHSTKKFTQKQIGFMVGIDARRVSDIITGKRDQDGRIVRR